MPPTSGFLLSALPRSPAIPQRIGRIDTREMYDAVRAGLDSAEQIRSAPGRALLAEEQMRTGLAETEARQTVLPTLTDAMLTDTPLRSRLLAADVETAPIRSRLLSAQVTGVENTIAAQQVQRERESAMRLKAAVEMPALLQEREEANKLAGYNETAAALGNLRVKYPWIALPEFKDTLSKSLDEEQQAALKAAAAQADQESKERIATTRAGATVSVQQLRSEATKTSAALRGGTSALLVREAELIEKLAEYPDDFVLTQQLESVRGALNRVSASERINPNAAKVSPPAGLVLLSNQQKADAIAVEAQKTLNAALESGDPGVIEAAQAEYNDAATKAAAAKKEWELYHAERTKKISRGIDAAAIQELAGKLGKGGSAPTTPKPTSSQPGGKTLTPDKAAEYLEAAGNDKNKARELARKDGWTF